MINMWKHYHTPSSIDEALNLLQQYNGEARVIAGGTDLLVDMREENGEPQTALIDITRIPELNAVEQIEDHIYLGAAVTHTQITKSALIQQNAACLVESCGVVGGPQVRNVGTIGGNVVHALPAGDGTTSLVALDAEADIVRDGQRQWVPIRDMYLGPAKSYIDPTRDILIRLRFSVRQANQASAFSRIMRPHGVALPILGCALWVQSDDAGQINAARVCIAPVSRTPQRIAEIEAVLIGQSLSDETITQAANTAIDTITPRTSKYRATADYRKDMAGVLVTRTLNAARQRLIGEGITA